jgi:hypothetical protein
MDPQQELFTALREKLIAEFGEDNVYDGALPPEGAQYPFVYLADASQTDTQTKSGLIGTVTQTIHVWHNSPAKRGTVSDMIFKIKVICARLEETDNYGWLLSDVTARILPDTTTKQPLLHGVIEAGYKFS